MSDETQAGATEVRAGQRIAKVMARAGVCSRRDAEALIAAGRVSVNGLVLDSPAINVSEADEVRVDGEPLPMPERTRLFLFHKSRGFVTTARDPEGRATVFSALPSGLPRLVAVGRLDINTEGLLLLTNDGGLARVLELPSTGWLRRYRVRAHGKIDQGALDRLGDGVAIDGVDYRGVEARLDREQGANAWLTVGLREGKNREIKKILEHLGLAVNRLIRVSFGPFELGDLAEGEFAEVRTRVLRDQLGAQLARQANANFDAPLIVRDGLPPPTERKESKRPQAGRAGRETVGTGRATQARSGRGASDAKSGSERNMKRRAPPPPSTPGRRRKHVSALRAEIAADAAGPRRRVERGATRDRKGRSIPVERFSRAGIETRGRGARPGARFEVRSEPGKARDSTGRDSKPRTGVKQKRSNERSRAAPGERRAKSQDASAGAKANRAWGKEFGSRKLKMGSGRDERHGKDGAPRARRDPARPARPPRGRMQGKGPGRGSRPPPRKR